MTGMIALKLSTIISTLHPKKQRWRVCLNVQRPMPKHKVGPEPIVIHGVTYTTPINVLSKDPINRVTGVITPVSGVITLLITGDGANLACIMS